MGLQNPSSAASQLQFNNVRVPVGNLLGKEGQGFKVAQTRLGPARIHHCMRALGSAEVLIELMMARASGRETFGRLLADYDTVQRWIAESRIEVEQARLLVQRAAWLLDRDGHAAAWRDVSIIKVVVPRMVQGIADRAVQLYGAMGGSDDTPIHSIFAHMRAMRIADGPDEVHLRQIYRMENKPGWSVADSPYNTPLDTDLAEPA
jgi:acyl-CoA dehydrogenase